MQSTAQLEFWETYEYSELFQSLENVNTYLRETIVNDSTDKAESLDVSQDESTEDIGDLIDADLVEDDNLLADLESDSLSTDSAEQLSFEEFAQENPLYAVLYPNVNQQNQIQQGPVVGFCAVKDTSTLNEYLI